MLGISKAAGINCPEKLAVERSRHECFVDPKVSPAHFAHFLSGWEGLSGSGLPRPWPGFWRNCKVRLPPSSARLAKSDTTFVNLVGTKVPPSDSTKVLDLCGLASLVGGACGCPYPWTGDGSACRGKRCKRNIRKRSREEGLLTRGMLAVCKVEETL